MSVTVSNAVKIFNQLWVNIKLRENAWFFKIGYHFSVSLKCFTQYSREYIFFVLDHYLEPPFSKRIYFLSIYISFERHWRFTGQQGEGGGYPYSSLPLLATNEQGDICSNAAFIYLHSYRSSRPEVFCKKGVLKNFAKFTGKHLCQRLFFNKVAGWLLLHLVMDFKQMRFKIRFSVYHFLYFFKNNTSLPFLHLVIVKN